MLGLALSPCNTTLNKGVRVPPLPLHAREVWIGDSFVGTYANMQGFNWWGRALSGAKGYTPIGYNKGVGGDETSDVLARMAAIVALAPKFATLMIGTNNAVVDGLGTTAINAAVAAAVTDVQSIVDQLWAVECRTLVVPMMRRWDNSYELFRSAYNAALGSAFGSRPWATFAADAADVWTSTAFTQADSLHPNALGAYTLGAAIAPYRSSMFVADSLLDLVSDASNIFAAAGDMPGTSGVVTSPITGVAPTGWTCLPDIAGEAGAQAASKSTIGPHTAAQIDFGAGNGGTRVRYRCQVARSVLIGEIYDNWAEVEVMGTGCSLVSVSGITATSEPGSAISGFLIPAGTYVFRSYPAALVANASFINIDIRATASAGDPSFAVRLARAYCAKAPDSP